MSESLPVLVGEDEEFLLSFFEAALERTEAKVVGATSGSAQAAFLERPFRIPQFIELTKKTRSPQGQAHA